MTGAIVAMRFGPGPVFIVEMVAVARRWQTYAVRAGLVAFLLITLSLVWANDHRASQMYAGGQLNHKDYAELGSGFATAILMTQLALVLLAAPAATAGAICLDKMRGNLTLLMATHLTSLEIILGKLFARLMPVLCLIAASLPVLFATSLLGGVSGELLVSGFVVLVGAAVASCAIALVFSVYVGKPHEALMLSYFVILAWLLCYPLFAGITGIAPPRWMLLINPFAMMFAPMSQFLQIGPGDYIYYVSATFIFAAVIIGWVIWRLRRIVLIQSNRPLRKRWSIFAIPRRRRIHWLNSNPLRWYERHRKRLSRAGRVIWFIFVGGSLAASVWVMIRTLEFRSRDEVAMVSNTLIVGIGLLLTTVGAVTALADERARGSLDILMTTPLTTRQIVAAKWRAAFATVPKVLALPIVVAGVVLLANWGDTGRFGRNSDTGIRCILWLVIILQWLSCGLLLTSVGFWLATLVKHFGRAIGIAVAFYVGMAIGWMVLVMAVSAKEDEALSFIAASPIFMAAYGTACLMGWEPDKSMNACIIGATIWSLGFLVSSWFLYLMTLRMFDRKMGRISLRAAGMPRVTERRSKPPVRSDVLRQKDLPITSSQLTPNP